MTLLCVPILVNNPDVAPAQAAQAKAGGADLVEYRVEGYLGDESIEGHAPEARLRAILNMVDSSPIACILTCRDEREGGRAFVEEDHRLELIERASRLRHPPRYIDVELALYERGDEHRRRIDACVGEPGDLSDPRPSLILSVHDFAGRPADLLRRVSRLASHPRGAVHKIAYRARSIRDGIEALGLCVGSPRPTIAIAMGDEGAISRLLAGKVGALLTFASLDERSSAPGQPDLGDLVKIYRGASIRPSTKVYGVIGWPVSHSLSPRLHNAGFHEIGWDGVYVPLPVAGGGDVQGSYASFKASLLELLEAPHLALRGVSVTIPHKENLVRLASERGWAMDEASRACGAANTLAVEASGIRVFNTDAVAIDDLLACRSGFLPGANAAILGAGGVARAAAWACARAGVETMIFARRREQAERLASDIASRVSRSEIHVGDLNNIPARPFMFIVNATPLGMKGGPDEKKLPMSEGQLGVCAEKAVVLESVVTPERTPFLEAAIRAGARAVVTGRDLLVAQARLQFHAWTGTMPPKGDFERAIAMPSKA